MAEILKSALNHNFVFWLCLIVSLALIITSFFIPPMAEISGSVLAAVGEIFAFAALGSLISAIEKGKDATLRHNSTSITIGDKLPPRMPEPPYEETEEMTHEESF